LPGAADDRCRRVPRQGTPARRYAGLIAADLTALLRFELARSALRDPSVFADYAAARAVLLPLARLDAEFDGLESLLASGSKNEVAVAGAPPDQELLALSRAR
jgi:hypothetical protein